MPHPAVQQPNPLRLTPRDRWILSGAIDRRAVARESKDIGVELAKARSGLARLDALIRSADQYLQEGHPPKAFEVIRNARVELDRERDGLAVTR